MNSFEKEIKDRMSQRVANIANNFSKGENDFLTQEDFEGLKKTNEVYTPDDILNYRADLQKAFDDEEIEEKDYVKGIEEIAGLKTVRVENGLNMPKTFFFKSLVEDLEKAEPEDDDDDEDYDDMEKAISGKGEGSRGGNVIGHMKNGKPIYKKNKFKKYSDVVSFVDEKHKDFTPKEHEEAAKFHKEKYDELVGEMEAPIKKFKGEDTEEAGKLHHQLINHAFHKEAHIQLAEGKRDRQKEDKKEEAKFEKLVDKLEGGDSSVSNERFFKVMKKYLGKDYNHDDYMITGRGGSTAKNLITALKEKGADLYYVMSDLYSKGKLGSDYYPKN